MMIICPITKLKYNINSNIGKSILRQYIQTYSNGGSKIDNFRATKLHIFINSPSYPESAGLLYGTITTLLSLHNSAQRYIEILKIRKSYSVPATSIHPEQTVLRKILEKRNQIIKKIKGNINILRRKTARRDFVVIRLIYYFFQLQLISYDVNNPHENIPIVPISSITINEIIEQYIDSIGISAHPRKDEMVREWATTVKYVLNEIYELWDFLLKYTIIDDDTTQFMGRHIIKINFLGDYLYYDFNKSGYYTNVEDIIYERNFKSANIFVVKKLVLDKMVEIDGASLEKLEGKIVEMEDSISPLKSKLLKEDERTWIDSRFRESLRDRLSEMDAAVRAVTPPPELDDSYFETAASAPTDFGTSTEGIKPTDTNPSNFFKLIKGMFKNEGE